MRRASVLAAVLLAVPAIAAPAGAARAATPAPSLTLWVGSTAPGTELRGVRLSATGAGTIVKVAAKQRATGTVTTTGAFAAPAPALKGIRAAARALFATAPKVAVARGGGEMYATATITVGAVERTELDLHAASPAMAALLRAVNAALGPARALPVPVDGPARAFAAVKTLSSTAAQTAAIIGFVRTGIGILRARRAMIREGSRRRTRSWASAYDRVQRRSTLGSRSRGRRDAITRKLTQDPRSALL